MAKRRFHSFELRSPHRGWYEARLRRRRAELNRVPKPRYSSSRNYMGDREYWNYVKDLQDYNMTGQVLQILDSKGLPDDVKMNIMEMVGITV